MNVLLLSKLTLTTFQLQVLWNTNKEKLNINSQYEIVFVWDLIFLIINAYSCH